jgi:hypothetical protein
LLGLAAHGTNSITVVKAVRANQGSRNDGGGNGNWCHGNQGSSNQGGGQSGSGHNDCGGNWHRGNHHVPLANSTGNKGMLPSSASAASAASAYITCTNVGYQVDPNLYLDTGATDHITINLDRLSFSERYKGTDKVQVGNDAGLHIAHIGQSSIITSAGKPLALRNVLHVPHITKNLISIHKLTKDNVVFVQFHPNSFVIKDLATWRTRL